MALNILKFQILFNTMLLKIEQVLEKQQEENDIDYDINYNIMTINFIDNSKIIISKQESFQQIWLATQTNGYHFNYINKKWLCSRSKLQFWKILENAFLKQGKIKIKF
ncbi:iron donor protein CyaY [Buchnera aphidicola]|uniref:iron donor protein CyaY n=1 Tax=Buchnera aphidicola TaxID=9 RepID=UPI003464B9F0